MHRHHIRTSSARAEVQKPNSEPSPATRRVLVGLIKYRVMVRKRLWHFLLSLLDTRVPILASHSLSTESRQQIKEFLQAGDVLLESNRAYPGWQLLSRLMVGSPWMHAAVYVGNGIVVDAGTEPRVARIAIDEFLNTTDIIVYRPRFAGPEDAQAAVSYVLKQIGRPFNVSFDHGDNRSFYCSQLVSQALLQMPHPINLPVERVLWK